MLSEISRLQQDKYCMILLERARQTSRTYRGRTKNTGCWRVGGGKTGSSCSTGEKWQLRKTKKWQRAAVRHTAYSEQNGVVHFQFCQECRSHVVSTHSHTDTHTHTLTHTHGKGTQELWEVRGVYYLVFLVTASQVIHMFKLNKLNCVQ